MASAIIIFGFSGESAWAKKKKSDKQKEPKVVETAPIKLPPKLTPNLIEKQRSEALCEDLDPNTSPHWLPDNSDDTFLALYFASITAKIQGTLLLLPENAHHPDWPGTIHQLRTSMPDEGWSTVSIALPDYISTTKIPPRPIVLTPKSSNDSNEKEKKKSKKKQKKKVFKEVAEKQKPTPVKEDLKQEDSKQDNKLPFEERTHQRISEALNFIESKGTSNGKIIVVAEGLSALWITEFLTGNSAQASSTNPRVDAVIFIGGRSISDFKHINLSQSTIKIEQPFLDITNSNDESYSMANQRSKLAKQAGHKQYQRLILASPLHHGSQDSQLFSRIKGWLKRHFDRK